MDAVYAMIAIIGTFTLISCFSLGYVMGHADGKEEAKEQSK